MTPECHQLDKDLVKAVVQETFLLLGIDATEPLENQRDFMYLRELREGSERWAMRSRLILFAAACTAGFSMLIWIVKKAIIGD